MNDGMGVQQQISHERDGILVSPGPDESLSDWRFGRAVVELLQNDERRLGMAEEAERLARRRCAPEVNINRFYDAFNESKEHLDESVSRSGGRFSLTKPPPAYHLARWTGLHVAAAALGSVRRGQHEINTDDRPASWDKVVSQSAEDLKSKVRSIL